MRNVLLAGCLALILATSGCLESKIVYTVNPDGSGKFSFDNFMAPPPQLGAADAKPDMDKMTKSALEQTLKSCKGVDAWSDLSYEVAKDGRLHVQGVGYFADVTKVRAQAGDNSIKWSKNDKGMTLELVMKDEKKQAAAKPKELTDAEVAEQVKQAKALWQQNKAIMTTFFSGLKIEQTFMLPGKLGDVEGFEKTDKGGVQVVIEGKKLLEAMDKVMSDDKLMTECIKAGRDPMKEGPDQEKMTEMVFGRKIKAFKADVTGELKPLFDYKAEMEKAKAGQDAMVKKLGLDLTSQPLVPDLNSSATPPGQ